MSKCPVCGKTFYNPKHPEQKRCSLKCFGLAIKGKPSWAKGKKFTKEHRRKLSQSSPHYWLGKKASPETIEKHRIRMMGNTIRRGSRYTEKQRKALALAMSGNGNPRWKGGKRKDKTGYLIVYSPNHPYARRRFVREHRLVMENYLGRILLPTEIVHHIDGDKANNHIDNLLLFKSNKEHVRYHNFLKGEKA